MLQSIEIKKNIYWVGINDRNLHLFENLWPLPYGVVYNSYLIDDNKVALVDTVEGSKSGEYLKKIQSIIGKHKCIDYLIVNHMEPDHSGQINELIKHYPNIKIIGNCKTFDMMKSFYGVTEENTHEVKEGDTVDLGNHKLKFYMTPMVHWPETMMTYELNNDILFAGDAFGSFGALDGGIFDDEVDLDFFEDEMRRYYSNIVGKYGSPVQRALKKLSNLNIKTICSTHGPIWRSELNKVVYLYDKWSKYEAEEGVVIVYGSMYGNTKTMAETIARAVSESGIEKVRIYDASKTHPSYILSDIWKYKGLIIGSCVYNANLFPPIDGLVKKLVNRNIKNRVLGIFGNYSWSGGAIKNLKTFAEKCNLDLAAEPLDVKSSPKTEDISRCINIGKAVAQKVKNCN